MRQRVVHVEEVEPGVRGDLGHLRREGERVGRRHEERVARRDDLVEEDARPRQREPRGQRVGDEVHLVAAVGQRDAELRRDDAAAAERRVAGDADLHGPSRLRSRPRSPRTPRRDRRCAAGGRVETNPSPNSAPIREAEVAGARLDRLRGTSPATASSGGSREVGIVELAREGEDRRAAHGHGRGHVHDERRLVHVGGREVDRLLRPVRGVRGLELAQARVEDGVGDELAGAPVVGVAVVRVRGQDDARTFAADDVDDGELVLARQAADRRRRSRATRGSPRRGSRRPGAPPARGAPRRRAFPSRRGSDPRCRTAGRAPSASRACRRRSARRRRGARRWRARQRPCGLSFFRRHRGAEVHDRRPVERSGRGARGSRRGRPVPGRASARSGG